MKNRRFSHYVICAVIAVAAATGCVCAPSAFGQGGLGQRPSGGMGAAAKDEIPSSLEDRLAAALAKNPDILATQARVKEAEAELNRIRLEVTRRVVAAHNALDTQHNEISIAELRSREAQAHYQQLEREVKKQTGAVDLPQARQAMFAYEEARRGIVREESKIADLEAELRYLLGRFPKGVAQQTGTLKGILIDWTGMLSTPPRDDDKNPMLERIRKPFDQPFHLEFVEMPLDEVLQFLSDDTGVQFVIQPVALAEYDIDAKMPITVSVRNVESLAVALMVVQDLIPGLRFVVRDYGILVAIDRMEPGTIFVHDPLERGKQSKEK